MFCKNCGNYMDDNASFCSKCGSTNSNATGNPTTEPSYNQTPSTPPVVDNGGALWGLLGCCFPIVGLILFLVWKDSKPKTAKAAGIGAAISVGLSILYYILVLVLGASYGIMSY